MEFRCRLGHPRRRDHRRRLRRRQRGAAPAASSRKRALRPRHSAGRRRGARLVCGCRTGARISTREFLVFNQELATLLKAGMPLVQSLDILRRRVDEPGVQVGAGRRPRARAGGERAVGGVRGARHAVPRRLHGVAAGRREERQPRAGHPPLRGLREGRREREAQDDLGAGLPGHPARAVARRRRRSSCLRVVPEFGAFYDQFSEELPLSTRIIVAVSDFRAAYFVLIVCSVVCGGRRHLDLAEDSRRSGSGSIAGSLQLPVHRVRSRRSSRRRRRRGRWRRCSAAASRW